MGLPDDMQIFSSIDTCKTDGMWHHRRTKGWTQWYIKTDYSILQPTV